MSTVEDGRLMELYRGRLRRAYAGGPGKDPVRIWSEAEIIWSGVNYLIIRDGLYDGQRTTNLYCRNGLLLQFEKSLASINAMVALALTSIHPVHRRRNYFDETLHVTGNAGNYRGVEFARGRRWSRTLRQELIAHARKKDMAFHLLEEKLIARLEGRNSVSLENAKFALEALGEGPPTTRKDGILCPVGVEIETRPFGEADRMRFRFKTGTDEQVRIRLTSLVLSGPEFRVLVEALAQIQELREEEEESA
jgi:hypothetical protein